MKITIMGLGLHGGGIASARFLAERGADLTVTDLRDQQTLLPSMDQLRDLKIRYVLGRHEIEDFRKADMVIKNPAVPRRSPYLQAARRIETDLSLFLEMNRRPLIAVTGSKGKSTTVSALHAILLSRYPDALLGGNITVSPLTFASECTEEGNSPVILELSSWQLADIEPPTKLMAFSALITNIMADHQNAYPGMAEYVADKKRIFAGQNNSCYSICPYDDFYLPELSESARGRLLYFSSDQLPGDIEGSYLRSDRGYIRRDGQESWILPTEITLQGRHNRLNLLAAATLAALTGIDYDSIRDRAASFGGIEHRMELISTGGRLNWINDSAATIPEATAAALKSLTGEVHLITGGTDKELNFDAFAAVAELPASIHLLEGSATNRMIEILKKQNISYSGPFNSLEEAVESAGESARKGSGRTSRTTILFSPGSTSFGMFLNEFNRGRQFKELVLRIDG